MYVLGIFPKYVTNFNITTCHDGADALGHSIMHLSDVRQVRDKSATSS